MRGENTKLKRKRLKRKYSLPRADITLEREIEILKGLVTFSEDGKKPVKYNEITIGIHPTAISTELNFFASINIAEKKKGGKYIPTQFAKEFITTLDWNEQNGKEMVGNFLLATWFGKIVNNMLTIKRELDINNLISELGRIAKADPKSDRKAIKRLLEWLQFGEVIEIGENGIVKLKRRARLKVEKPEEKLVIRKEEEIISPHKGKINILFVVEITPETKQEDIKKIIKAIKNGLKEE